MGIIGIKLLELPHSLNYQIHMFQAFLDGDESSLGGVKIHYLGEQPISEHKSEIIKCCVSFLTSFN